MKTSKAVAYHEAGHAVISEFLGLRIKYATAHAAADSAGHVMGDHAPIEPEPLSGLFARNAIFLRKAIVCYAGNQAQKRFSPNSVRSYQASSDRRQIMDCALAVSRGDMKEANALFRWLELHTARLVEMAWPQIENVASELIRKGKLPRAEVLQAMRSAPVPTLDSVLPI